MNESTKEQIGFLCRWGLFALCWAMVGAVVYLSFSAAQSAKSEADPHLVLPDRLAAVDRPFYAVGNITPRGTSVFIWKYGRLPLGLNMSYGEKNLYFSIPRQQAGDEWLTVWGNPYGGTAFERQDAMVRVVPGDAPLLLLDARLQGDPTQGQAFLPALAAMKARGAAAILWMGAADDGLAFRKMMRSLNACDPVLMNISPNDLKWPLRKPLSDAGKQAKQVVLVTGDETLARMAKGLGMRVCLVASASAAKDLGVGSIGKLVNIEEWLDSQPIISKHSLRPM